MTPHTQDFSLGRNMFKKLVLILLFLILILTQSEKPVSADKVDPVPVQQMSIEAKTLDPRAVVLRDWLAKYDSPLENNAQDFIDASDQYGVDWKLTPAIAGVESTFGNFTPGGFNAWGWGVYGDQAIYFKNQREAIFEVTKGLKENYINRGLVNPYQINYVYAASPFWGGKVVYFMNNLDSFAKSKQLKGGLVINTSQLKPQTYSTSATLSAQPTTPKLALNK